MSQLSITTINIKSHNVRYRGSYIIQSWRRLNAPHGDDTETARHTRVLNHRHPRRRHTLTVTPLTWDTQHTNMYASQHEFDDRHKQQPSTVKSNAGSSCNRRETGLTCRLHTSSMLKTDGVDIHLCWCNSSQQHLTLNLHPLHCRHPLTRHTTQRHTSTTPSHLPSRHTIQRHTSTTPSHLPSRHTTQRHTSTKPSHLLPSRHMTQRHTSTPSSHLLPSRHTTQHHTSIAFVKCTMSTMSNQVVR